MHLNCSDPRSYPRAVMSSSAYLTSICYCICFCIAFVGNFTMFIILVRNQVVKVRRVHTLLLHMNVAHLVVTLIYMPKEIIHNITVAWWGGDLLCRSCKFFDNFGNALSANILICISLDRFYSIFSPLYTLNAKRSVQRMVVVAWFISLLTSLPSVYLIPLFFIVACYSLILHKISSKARSSPSCKSDTSTLRRSGEATLERAKSRTLRMTFVIVSAFLLCWTPYAAASFIHFTYHPSPIPPLIRKLIYAFAVFNSAISPYLYGYFSFDLKKELMLLWKCSTSELSDKQLSISNFAANRHQHTTTKRKRSLDDTLLDISEERTMLMNERRDAIKKENPETS
ncbi:unnamed protein product [Anisakis simplex]|uniref:Gonadotropin-releasing hormone receptor (inferred by orthology to a human protein) n=1 Tax=Anisakis simplex TaxID=6269 RepID=A0A158PMT3_ANISI|nr:unnamed protein product [Anisakis simplex]